jgi:hypothetical protein
MDTLVPGDKVSYLNARTQRSEIGTIDSINDSLSDGTIIVTIICEGGITVQVPRAALQKEEQSTIST